MINGISYVSIGVADMAPVRALWIDALGLEVVAASSGPDAQLTKLWHIPAEQIAEQLLLRTPGAETGWLHFVQFRAPGDAIRKDAAPTDRCAKNLDVNCVNMPVLVEQLKNAGYEFRSAISEYEIDGLGVREVQMPVHDGVNVVFIEVLGEGFDVDYTAKGFAGLTSFVVIVPDAQIETEFYQALFGFAEIMRHRISGPAIEQAAGLPPGTALDMRLTGHPDNLFGRMELIEYEGISGANLFARAVPPATGILSAGFRVASIEAFKQHAAEQGVTIGGECEVETPFATGTVLQLCSPAGLRIEVSAGASP